MSDREEIVLMIVALICTLKVMTIDEAAALYRARNGWLGTQSDTATQLGIG